MTLLLEDGASDHVTEMAPATERTETSAVAGTGSGAVIAVLLATRLLRLQCCEAGRRWPAPAARRTARPATMREGGPSETGGGPGAAEGARTSNRQEMTPGTTMRLWPVLHALPRSWALLWESSHFFSRV